MPWPAGAAIAETSQLSPGEAHRGRDLSGPGKARNAAAKERQAIGKGLRHTVIPLSQGAQRRDIARLANEQVTFPADNTLARSREITVSLRVGLSGSAAT